MPFGVVGFGPFQLRGLNDSSFDALREASPHRFGAFGTSAPVQLSPMPGEMFVHGCFDGCVDLIACRLVGFGGVRDVQAASVRGDLAGDGETKVGRLGIADDGDGGDSGWATTSRVAWTE